MLANIGIESCGDVAHARSGNDRAHERAQVIEHPGTLAIQRHRSLEIDSSAAAAAKQAQAFLENHTREDGHGVFRNAQ